MTRKEFVEKYAPVIFDVAAGTGLFPSVFMSQAILESSDSKGNAGGSLLASKYNNFFGIKADKSWKGRVVNLKTREVLNGSDQVIVDGFRVYDNPIDSFRDRVKFLQQNKRYSKVFTAQTPEQQAKELQAARYATDPNYAKIIIGIITGSNLKSLDLKKK